MQTTVNTTFQKLLTEYGLPADGSFDIEIPAQVRAIIGQGIVLDERGAHFAGEGVLDPPGASPLEISDAEDFSNHFHIDGAVPSSDPRELFMLGVKTILFLAARAEAGGIGGVCFTYYFQTPELAKAWELAHGFDDPESEPLLSDRLSFYRKRPGAQMLREGWEKKPYGAFMLIEI